MSAAKKACPVCGCENAESDFFCQNCGSDVSLENRAVTPAAPKAAAASSPRSQPAHQPRLCPKCGQANEAIFILCTNCGFDLSAAGPGPNRANRLFLVVGRSSIARESRARADCQGSEKRLISARTGRRRAS